MQILYTESFEKTFWYSDPKTIKRGVHTPFISTVELQIWIYDIKLLTVNNYQNETNTFLIWLFDNRISKEFTLHKPHAAFGGKYIYYILLHSITGVLNE